MSGAPAGPAQQSPEPTDQQPWFDDPAIAADERLLRICKSPLQTVLDDSTNVFIISSQAFGPLGPGVSVEICSMYEAAGHTAEGRVADAPSNYGAMEISAAQVRATKVSSAPDAPPDKFGVAFTPLSPTDKGGPNPYHADIFPRPTGGGNKALTKAAKQVVAIDQSKAAVAYARRQVS